jgi:hypothetical protein
MSKQIYLVALSETQPQTTNEADLNGSPLPKEGTATLFEDHTPDQSEGLQDSTRYVHATGPHYESSASECLGLLTTLAHMFCTRKTPSVAKRRLHSNQSPEK